MNKWIYRGVVILLMIIIMFFEFFIELKDNDFYAYFLDVGQGDSTLIRTPEGMYILIDTGAGELALEELGRYFPISSNTIELLIISHFDKDHIGALGELLRTYNVKNVIFNENYADYISRYLNYLKDINKLEEVDMKVGCCVVLDFIDTGNTIDDDNSNSLAFKLKYKDIEMFFGGDLPSSVEDKIADVIGDIEVLKVSHHGSRESTSMFFLNLIKPEYSLISSGENNSYGHPHNEVLINLNGVGSKILRTDISGTQVILVDEWGLKRYSSEGCRYFCSYRLYFSKYML